MRHPTRTWLLAVLVLLWAGVVAADELLVPVLQVIDGDTIAVRYRGQRELVRYTGINAPETNHPTKGEEPGGREATEFNRRLVGDHRVRLELDVQVRDRYGRILAYVWVKPADGGEVMVNAMLLYNGYAQVTTYPPNVTYAAYFRDLEGNARLAGRGLWSGSSESGWTTKRR